MRQVQATRESQEYRPAQELTVEPWNTATQIELSGDELMFFEHYITAGGPILDLFDPARHFSSVVPHLARRNVGLLESLLAVGACHMASELLERTKDPSEHTDTQTTAPPRTPASTQRFYDCPARYQEDRGTVLL